MAGIEKICEYSGEYPGSLMYGYKRDLIQVMPEYRKSFKNVKCLLKIWETEWYQYQPPKNKRRSSFFIYSGNLDMIIDDYDDYYYDVPKDHKEFKLFMKINNRFLSPEYKYCLEVLDPNWSCPTGNTEFYNYTYSKPKRIIKRIRRLVGSKFLSISKMTENGFSLEDYNCSIRV